ncbi:MAG: hypothetical protein R2706_01260 [Acidimicrobiales bacterium]
MLPTVADATAFAVCRQRGCAMLSEAAGWYGKPPMRRRFPGTHVVTSHP